MRVLCLISSGRGHLDLGGNGFTKYITQLNVNNEVHIISTTSQCKLLENITYKTHVTNHIDQLMLPVEEHETYQFTEYFFQFLKLLELKVKSINPDLAIVDRILGLADPLLNSLSIKYISMGTNGIDWRKHKGFILDPNLSVHNKNGLTAKLSSFLKWPKTRLSAWSQSKYLNICFVDRDFYPLSNNRVHHINMFSENSYLVDDKKNIGISLGNGYYNQEEFCEKLNAILSIFPSNLEILIFGNNDRWKTLSKNIKTPNKLRFLGYVNFNDYFKSISHLIFAGGVGTLWSCIQYGVIPIIISGNIHDQNYNATYIKQKLDIFISNIFEKQGYYLKKIEEMKNSTKYTHSIKESVSIIESEIKLGY